MRYLILILLFTLCTPVHAADRTYSIATGNPSGMYYPYGGGIARIWSREIDNFNMKAEVTAASVTNIIQVAKGDSEAAISQGDAIRDAIYGTGKFSEVGKMPVRVIARLYPNLVHLITLKSSDIHSIEDLRGKTVSTGAPGSGNAVTSRNILSAMDIGPDDFDNRSLNYAETANAIRDGAIDAGFMVGGIGTAAIVELALTRDVRLIPFSDAEMQIISEKVPAYTSFEVPAGIYHGVDEPVQVPTLWNMMVVHEDFNPETVYEMTRTLFEQNKEMRNIVQVAKFTVPENSFDMGDIPLHPGAQRFYEEYRSSKTQTETE